MNLVCTIVSGRKFEEIAELTLPTIKNYAKKIGAEFKILENKTESFNPSWNKFVIYDLLTKYERIIYLDIDIIVRDDCPNLFEIVPEDKIGMFNEGKFTSRQSSIHEAVVAYEEDLSWKGDYYNAGVMILSKIHRPIFKPVKQFDLGMYEQGYLNLRIQKDEYKVKELEYKFNRMTCMDDLTGEDRLSSYIIHYAGGTSSPDLVRIIREDLKKWEESKPNYDFKRNILISVGGGLGDQIASQPVVRYIKEKVYPTENIEVISDFPIVFKNIGVPVFDKRDYVRTKQTLFQIETMPIPEKPIWTFMAQTLMHTTDFASLSAIRMILPNKEKQIKLEVNENSFKEIDGIVPKEELSELVLIHPGRGWSSKTFPKDWWEEVIAGLVNKVKVAVIGKHISNEQGYVNITVPHKCYDLRNMLSYEGLFYLVSKCFAVVSNDSAPVHIAGSFNPWIILIPTCKHPDHVLPWRNGSQYYKTKTLYKKLTCDDIDSSPTQVHGQTIDWIKNGDIRPYLPNPKDVVKAVLDLGVR